MAAGASSLLCGRRDAEVVTAALPLLLLLQPTLAVCNSVWIEQLHMTINRAPERNAPKSYPRARAASIAQRRTNPDSARTAPAAPAPRGRRTITGVGFSGLGPDVLPRAGEWGAAACTACRPRQPSSSGPLPHTVCWRVKEGRIMVHVAAEPSHKRDSSHSHCKQCNRSAAIRLQCLRAAAGPDHAQISVITGGSDAL